MTPPGSGLILCIACAYPVTHSLTRRVDGLPEGPADIWLCAIETGVNVDFFELLLPEGTPTLDRYRMLKNGRV